MKGLVRRLWPRRSVLVRRVDRAEAVLRLVVLVAAIVLVPVALTLGSETYASQVHAGEEQSQARRQVAATLLQDAPGASMGAGGESASSRSAVRVGWTLPDGTQRTGTVPTADGLHAGATITIWLDEAGSPVSEPLSRDRAAAGAVAVALGSWVVGVGLLIALLVVAHILMNRRRSEAWRREWARVEPNWSRRPI